MRRLPLVLALTALALMFTVNASAYRQASTTQSMSLTVDGTSASALALSSSSPMVTEPNGVMRVDFQRGFTGGIGFMYTNSTPGVSVTGDRIQMLDVFRITNNSDLAQCVSVYVPASGNLPTNLSGIYGRLVGGATPGTQLAGSLGAQTSQRVALGATGSGTNVMVIDFHWAATSSASASTFEIRVFGQNQATCP